MDDEWKDRWFNAQIDEIEKLSKNLREIECDLIGLAAAVQEIRASFDTMSQNHTETSVQFTDMIRKNSDDILKHTAICPHPENWNKVWNRLTAIETAILKIRHEFDVKSLEANHKQDLDIKELMVNARNSGLIAGGGIGGALSLIITTVVNVLMAKP